MPDRDIKERDRQQLVEHIAQLRTKWSKNTHNSRVILSQEMYEMEATSSLRLLDIEDESIDTSLEWEILSIALAQDVDPLHLNLRSFLQASALVKILFPEKFNQIKPPKVKLDEVHPIHLGTNWSNFGASQYENFSCSTD